MSNQQGRARARLAAKNTIPRTGTRRSRSPPPPRCASLGVGIGSRPRNVAPKAGASPLLREIPDNPRAPRPGKNYFDEPGLQQRGACNDDKNFAAKCKPSRIEGLRPARGMDRIYPVRCRLFSLDAFKPKIFSFFAISWLSSPNPGNR